MPITPSDTPSSPSDYAAVTPHGQGTAPYNVQADLPDLTAVVEAAGQLTGAGVVYPQGPRQQATEALMQSPQGFGLDGYDIDQGGAAGWPTDVEPSA